MSVVANVAINIDGVQAQSVLKAIQSEVEKLNGTFDVVEKKGQGFGGAIKSAAGSLIGQLAAVTGAAFTLQQAFDVLAQQSKGEAALRTLGVNAQEATAEFTKLSASLQGQASVVELTTAAYDVASSGFANTADQVKILEAATKGAVGGLSDINTVGNAVTSVLNAYGMSADQAGNLVDGFIQTQNDGKIVLNEYANLIGRLAPLGAAAGVGIKELNAAVATITAQGVAPEAAVTGLAQAISSILKPTAEAQALASQLGIQFNETGLRTKGLSGFLQEVTAATGGSASELTTLFGSIDALKALLPLVSGNMKTFVENIVKQNEAAGVADKAFNDMRNSIGGALKEVKTSFENLVVSFAPLTPAIIAPFKVLAGTLQLVANNMKAIATISVFIGTLTLALNGAAIATKAWELATQGLTLAQRAAGAAAAFLQALSGPTGIAAVALAVGAATAAYVAMGAAIDNTGAKAEAAKAKQAGTSDEIKQQVNELQKVPSLQDQQISKQQSLLDAHRQTTAEINSEISSLERGASINSARYEAEKAINDLKTQQLEREYNLAGTAQERLNIAIAIFNQQVQGAQIELAQAMENIALEQRKLDLKVQQQQAKLKEIELEGKLQELKVIGQKDEEAAKEKINQKVQEALATQQQVIAETEKQRESQKLISEYALSTAEAQYRSKILAAQTALEQKATSDKIGLSQEEARRLADNLGNSAVNSTRLVDQIQRVSTNASNAAGNFIAVAQNAQSAANSIQNAANAQERLNALRGQGGGQSGGQAQGAAEGAYWKGGFTAFAQGGIVKKPTLGLIGEGGQPEYIIPESKAQGFAMNYLLGQRGANAVPGFAQGGYVGSTPNVSISTGPVTQMNGTNYVTTQDMTRAVQEGIAQTMRMLNQNPSLRQSVGIR